MLRVTGSPWSTGSFLTLGIVGKDPGIHYGQSFHDSSSLSGYGSIYCVSETPGYIILNDREIEFLLTENPEKFQITVLPPCDLPLLPNRLPDLR